MKKSGLILAASLAFSTAVFAQHEGAKHHTHTQTLKSKKLNALNFIKLTGGLGMSAYYGDICDGWDCYKLRHSLSAGAYFRYNNRFSFRADGFWTRLANDDETYKVERNLGFRTDVFELSASTMFDIFPFEHKFEKRRAVEPYAHAGIGIAYFNPMGKLDDKWVSLSKYETEGKSYNKSTVVIPFGVGVRTRLRHDINIAGEFTYRLTFTDYLDDVSSKHYKDPKTFTNPEAAILSDRSSNGYNPEFVRGNPKRNDGYFTFSVKVEYMIMAFSDLRSKGNLNRVPTGKKTIKRR